MKAHELMATRTLSKPDADAYESEDGKKDIIFCHVSARLADGTPTHSVNPDATALCINAAIMQAYHADVPDLINPVRGHITHGLCERLAARLNLPPSQTGPCREAAFRLARWNDAPERTHADVVNLLRAEDV